MLTVEDIKNTISGTDFEFYGLRVDEGIRYNVSDTANNSRQLFQDPDFDEDELFCVKPDKLDSMPHLRPGYVASQKIIHTLQSFSADWREQGKIPDGNIVIAQKQGI